MKKNNMSLRGGGGCNPRTRQYEELKLTLRFLGLSFAAISSVLKVECVL